MAEIQFSLRKKIKVGRPEHSLTPPLPMSDNISFWPYHPPPSKWTSCVYSSKWFIKAISKLYNSFIKAL